MGDLINLNSKPRVLELGNRKEKLEKRWKEREEKYEELKKKSREIKKGYSNYLRG